MTDETVSDLSYADTLWKAADALRGQVDAAEYKHVVLDLILLKYISDMFQSRYNVLRGELSNVAVEIRQLDNLSEYPDLVSLIYEQFLSKRIKTQGNNVVLIWAEFWRFEHAR